MRGAGSSPVETGDEIARVTADVRAATRRYLTLLAEFDRLRGWEKAGHRSCAHWLASRTCHDLTAAREHVRAAREMAEEQEWAAEGGSAEPFTSPEERRSS